MSKLRKGDEVVALNGNEKGRTGSVLSVKGNRVVVQGLNIRKKNVKRQGDQPGRIIDIETPIHISNLAVCDSEGKPLKLKVQKNKDGAREYVYMEKDKPVTYREVKKPKG